MLAGARLDRVTIPAAAAVLLAWAGAAQSAAVVVPAAVIDTAILADDAKSVRIEFAGGRSQSLPVDDPGATFGPPRLSADRRVASWQELRRDFGSYDSPVGIAIYARGQLNYAGCTYGVPWAWRLIGETRVVLRCAYPHGPPSGYLLLADIATGRPVARIKLAGEAVTAPAAALAWARGAFPE